MSMKIPVLNSFDKAFFGKTMAEWANNFRLRGNIKQSSKVQFSSVDDFNKHFSDQVFLLRNNLSKDKVELHKS